MANWALDLGTTNSGVACWDESLGKPRLIELPAVCRKLDAQDPLEAPRLVPSAVHFLEKPGALDRLGSWPPLARRFFLGRRALIGRPALERNDGVVHPSFVPTFKPGLSGEALRPLARVGRESVSARDAAQAFLRELLREIKRATGHRMRELVVTSPVTAFETYRAEVQQALRQLGVAQVRFIDEPVAAALGYGISLGVQRTVLVVDVGGGTMHVVLARLSPQGAVSGQATVLAKRGRPVGGNAVDGWVLHDLCRQLGHDLTEDDDEVTRLWRRLMLAEACRVKEAVFFESEAPFLMSPGGSTVRAASRPGSRYASLSRDRLREILDEQGFYRSLSASVEEVLESARMTESDVEDVLLVGGSTLLPGFFSWFEERFERRRVRAWQPFEAVVHGAACFAGNRMDALDYIVHDYAFVTHDLKTGEAQHTVIVPRGTRFPTPPDLWKRQLVPTCALGEPENVFKLLICEVSHAGGEERRFVWDAAGDLRKVGGASGDGQVVVPLNEASPTLGYLDPPHSPRDRRPRLEIAFGVSAERWLIATVRDLLTQRDLMREEPVVRLVRGPPGMWELIFPILTGGLGLWGTWSGIQHNRRSLQSWQEAATACGLRVEEISSPWAMRLRLKARAGPVEVRIEDPQRKDAGVLLTVAIPGPPGFSGVRIRREKNKPRGAREIELGDEPFDNTFFVEGPLRLVCALFDMEIRHLLISVNAECKVEISESEIRAEMFRYQVADLLPLLFEIGQRFTQPLDVTQRLAENAQRDPDAGARLRNLLLLAREHPREPATVELLRTACADPSPEVRLRAARELGNERRDVLMELAENTEDDSVSAQALSIVARELSIDRTKAILVLALRRRRLQTARAALEALGSSGDAAAVDVLAKVLAREKGELAAAAAEALGKTGNPAAEPPLLRALAHDKSDVQVAAANALARVGTAAAVLPLKEAAGRSPLDLDLRRATRQAIAEIQSRLQGASPGQLSLAGAEVGQLSLAPGEAGQLSLAADPGGQLSLPSGEPGQRS